MLCFFHCLFCFFFSCDIFYVFVLSDLLMWLTFQGHRIKETKSFFCQSVLWTHCRSLMCKQTSSACVLWDAGDKSGWVLQSLPLPAAGAHQSGQSQGSLRVWGVWQTWKAQLRELKMNPEGSFEFKSSSGVQSLHRLGPRGHGEQGSVSPRPPERGPHLRTASEIPEKAARLLPHPQQGECPHEMMWCRMSANQNLFAV